jgi:hypothetical protein
MSRIGSDPAFLACLHFIHTLTQTAATLMLNSSGRCNFRSGGT